MVPASNFETHCTLAILATRNLSPHNLVSLSILIVQKSHTGSFILLEMNNLYVFYCSVLCIISYSFTIIN